MRIFLDQDPFVPNNTHDNWRERGFWPARWVVCPGADEPPFVTAYRLRFELDAPARIHVSADERYILYMDGGSIIGRGPERGDPDHWFYESYELPAGDHILVAQVWTLGQQLRPTAQMSIHPGFLLAADAPFTETLSTGKAQWQAKILHGYQFINPTPAWGTGANLDIDGSTFDWGFEMGEGDGWQPVEVLRPGVGLPTGLTMPTDHQLKPATLPPMIDRSIRAGKVRFVADSDDDRVNMTDYIEAEADAWAQMLQDEGIVTITAHTRRRVLVDLEEYFCVYPEMTLSGSGTVQLLWAESLYEGEPNPWRGHKGDRNTIQDKSFIGVGDVFRSTDTAEHIFRTLWWQAGRYIQIVAEAGDSPLILHSLNLRETRYPLKMESKFRSMDNRLVSIIPMMVRGMQMCSHETYMDCPYYEQLMYGGDTRLEILTHYVMSRDDRLPRKAIAIFDASRDHRGIVEARYPNKDRQFIPAWSLWWVGMVYDGFYWRGDDVLQHMPGVRSTIEAFLSYYNSDGLIAAAPGWNIFDWVPEWEAGIPADAETGASAMLNWQFVLILGLVAELEDYLDETELAARDRRLAADLAGRMEAFWDEERGLYADDLGHQHFSEHTQCMAILSGHLDATRQKMVGTNLINDPDLYRATVWFSHYLFETYRVLDRVDVLIDRLKLWTDMVERGAKTPIEKPEPSRSDCHAWGSHPLYHYFATVLGIRPDSPGFETVEIRPRLASLQHAGGTLVHPRGEIKVDFRVDQNGSISGNVTLPEGVTGRLYVNDEVVGLREGPFSFWNTQGQACQ